MVNSRADDKGPSGLTYRDSGVDIDRANQAKQRIKDLARSTFDKDVVRDIGSFGGLFRPDLTGFENPVLVASADGVGTKLKIAFLSGVHHTVGIDLVAHCTNDVLVQGAFPLFFLDYIATGKLEPGVVSRIVEGLAEGCRQSGCALLGGETAEMPDFYAAGEYDLAGFIVGLVEESRIYDSSRVEDGDILIGLPSSGLHTNGYSLVRRLFFDRERLTVDTYIPEFGRTLGEELLEPHRNYLPVLKDLIRSDLPHAMAHVTGGGITENLNRILPDSLDAKVELNSWQTPPVFEVIQQRGEVAFAEMLRTFNMGIGMILAVSPGQLSSVEAALSTQKEPYRTIGRVVPGCGKVIYS